jgi:uncharacterized membrane protein
MKDQTFYKSTILLAAIGVALASFLLYNYLARPVVEICTISAEVNCDAVTKGSLSTLFGIPVSLIGLIGYLVILISAFLKYKKVILGAAIFGLIFCFRLTYLELFSVKIICPVCLACQIDMLAVFFLSAYANFKKSIVTPTL